jgi:progressive ankylosis protein
MSTAAPPLTLRRLLALWFPLALSFELMMLEGPSLQAAVSRLADPQVHLAAWGLTMSLSLLVESPVIMLLSTSIALVRDRASYLALQRFVVLLCLGCTALAGAVAFTPLYELVTAQVLGQPAAIREAARPALQIMLLWTAAIGWRRFYQGLLVRAGLTRLMSWGTFARLVAVLGTVLYLVTSSSPHPMGAASGTVGSTRSGVVCAATAIMAGVLVEALVSTWFAWPAQRQLQDAPPDAQPLTTARILAYHAPLAATTLMNLLAMPINSAALARLPEREATLAAWPVMFGALLVLRGWGMAIQEISVAHAGKHEDHAALVRFTWLVGGITSGITLLLVTTPLLELYLDQVMQVPANLHAYVRLGLGLCALQPLVTALASLLRGTLMARKLTPAVYRGTALSLLSLLGLLMVAVLLQVPGIWGASVAFMGSTVVELAYLALQVRQPAELTTSADRAA